MEPLSWPRAIARAWAATVAWTSADHKLRRAMVAPRGTEPGCRRRSIGQTAAWMRPMAGRPPHLGRNDQACAFIAAEVSAASARHRAASGCSGLGRPDLSRQPAVRAAAVQPSRSQLVISRRSTSVPPPAQAELSRTTKSVAPLVVADGPGDLASEPTTGVASLLENAWLRVTDQGDVHRSRSISTITSTSSRLGSVEAGTRTHCPQRSRVQVLAARLLGRGALRAPVAMARVVLGRTH